MLAPLRDADPGGIPGHPKALQSSCTSSPGCYWLWLVPALWGCGKTQGVLWEEHQGMFVCAALTLRLFHMG